MHYLRFYCHCAQQKDARRVGRDCYRTTMGRLGLYEEALTESAIGAFFDVYKTLGFGFLENVYVNALQYELVERGHKVALQFGVCVSYKGREIARQRLDLVVDNKLVIEIKSAYDLHPLLHASFTTTFEPPISKLACYFISDRNHE